MKESYKELLTEYVGKKLKEREEADDYDVETFALNCLFGFLLLARSNKVIMAKLELMVDAIRIHQSIKDYKVDKEYYEAEYKIGTDCLGYLSRIKLKKQIQNYHESKD